MVAGLGGDRENSELTPAEIRRIREKIGLSQVEAGELLGGGPRAFTKYEAGTIRPAAAVANLLRLLDANPSAVITLSGGKVIPIESADSRPYEVTGKHIEALSPRRLSLLMRRLLNAEALSGDLPMDGIHVAAVITASDGGEDARIEWQNGPERTKFLPNRFSQFQLKAGEISPAEAAAEVLTATAEVKPMISDILARGGAYIMVCGHSYDKQRIKARSDRVHKALAAAGLTVDVEKIQFRDADQIASWVNIHPPVAAWVLDVTQPGLVGPFKDWTHWAGSFDNSPWVSDPRLGPFRSKLRAVVGQAHGVARVVGLSGVGKSRLVHEALGPTDDEEGATPRLCDLVLYAVEAQVGSVAVTNIVQNLAASGFRAVIVVDRCSAGTHQDLVGMVKRTGSQLSLVTIDHEVPSNVSGDTLLVELAGEPVIEGMIKQIAPDLPGEDHRRLVMFARGFPQMANLLGQAWLKDASIAAATDDDLFDRIIFGRKPRDPLLLEAGMLLGAFRLLGIKDDLKDLDQIASLSRGRSAHDLRAALDELQARGVVQQHGRLVSLQPKPLAMSLAERQWRQWGQSRWDGILAGDLPPELRERVANQLAMLNDRPIATEVARYAARIGGPFASFDALSLKGNGEVVAALASIDAEAVVTLIEQILQPLCIEGMKNISGDLRRSFVHALEKIAFLVATFERAALLMLDLAVAENESWSNNSTGQFKALFPAILPNTEASAETRLRLLAELVQENDPRRMPIVVDALLEASNTQSSSRSVGPEVHGSRPALVPWRPKYWKEAWDYVIACVDMLATIAIRTDAVGAKARAGMASEFRSLVVAGLLDRVEGWVATVRATQPYWPEALTSLGDVLQFDRNALKPGEEGRIRKLIADLSPQDLEHRVRFIVTEMPWDFPVDEQLEIDERGKRQVEAVEDLARELLQRPAELNNLLPKLSTGNQRMSVQFGTAIAKLADRPLEWEKPIKAAVEAAAARERNFGLLAGYYSGLAPREPAAAAAFKQEAATSPVFGVALPIVCMYIGITPQDVALVCGALKTGLISPNVMVHWAYGGVLAKLPSAAVTPLFDQLLAMNGDAYSVALDVMGMYVHGAPARLEELRPQLRLAAINIAKRPKRRGSQMDEHHFGVMVGWLLKKGRDDPDACAVAAALAKHAADDPDGNARGLIKPVLPVMLSVFAPIVWPPFGQAIVQDRTKAWRIERLLGDSFSFADKKSPPILSVPDDILFAWAHEHPDVAPAFLATVLPVLTSQRPDAAGSQLHPLMMRLLNEFGDRGDVQRALVQNMHTFGWTGSLTTYYALYEHPLKSLLEHRLGPVRRWARVMLTQMRQQIDLAKMRDDEQTAHWEA